MALKVAVWYCKVHNVRFVEFLSGFIFEILYMEFSTYIVFCILHEIVIEYQIEA